MPDPEIVVRAENLGKKYLIGPRVRRGGRLLTEELTKKAFGVLKRTKDRLSGASASNDANPNELWALRDLSFEVHQGEVVGIIGRNGAGKSTLLKILSRITPPTRGYVEMKGRVASLLDIGTGFHPELTGRENIFLNGVILGMSRAEVVRKFDEIVAFAEVERFLDTPVKHYSSGMYVRLAFAVAAHLDPEILLVDEVLSVGDLSFQKKCLNKMEDVGQQGRTVFFVSHSMPAVTRLCRRAILIHQGRVVRDGPSDAVVSAYMRWGSDTAAAREWTDRESAPGDDIVRLRRVRAMTEDGTVSESFDIRKPIGVEMYYEVIRPGHILVPHLYFYNDQGICVFVISDQKSSWRRQARPVGSYTTLAWIPGNFLAEGMLLVGASINTMDPIDVHFYEREILTFQVVDSMEGDSARGDFGGHMPGVVRPMLEWRTDRVETEQEDGTGP